MPNRLSVLEPIAIHPLISFMETLVGLGLAINLWNTIFGFIARIPLCISLLNSTMCQLAEVFYAT